MVATVCWHFKSLHPDEVWAMPMRDLRPFLEVIKEATADG